MSADDRVIRVGTRKSALAQAQASQVIAALRGQVPELEFETRLISTAGDRVAGGLPLPSHQGIFVREIEEALLSGEIDLAVHSLKDMPCVLRPGLELGAVPERADARDVLIARGNVPLRQLPPGARIGTSSVRRRAQLMAVRRDVNVVELRGNIDTRLKKLSAGEVEALVIAAAGVIRLGLGALITEYLPPELMLPAPCQGALAVEVRAGDEAILSSVRCLDHAVTRACVTAERAFLRHLGGGCSLPVGAWAQIIDGQIGLRGQVVSIDGAQMVARELAAPMAAAEKLGHDLARQLLLESPAWVRQTLKDRC